MKAKKSLFLILLLVVACLIIFREKLTFLTFTEPDLRLRTEMGVCGDTEALVDPEEKI